MPSGRINISAFENSSLSRVFRSFWLRREFPKFESWLLAILIHHWPRALSNDAEIWENHSVISGYSWRFANWNSREAPNLSSFGSKKFFECLFFWESFERFSNSSALLPNPPDLSNAITINYRYLSKWIVFLHLSFNLNKFSTLLLWLCDMLSVLGSFFVISIFLWHISLRNNFNALFILAPGRIWSGSSDSIFLQLARF